MAQIYNNIDEHGSDAECFFITNKHDSDAWLPVPHLSTGNPGKTQTWHTLIECSDLYHQRTRFGCSDT